MHKIIFQLLENLNFLLCCEQLSTSRRVTIERVSVVKSVVSVQSIQSRETGLTGLTGERLFSGVHSNVNLQAVRRDERLAAVAGFATKFQITEMLFLERKLQHCHNAIH